MVITTVSRARLALLVVLLAASCGPVEPCPDGSMLEGPSGLELEEQEHELGWGQADCWLCHSESTLHRLGCTPDVDLQAIEARVQAEGLDACADCHGANGAQDIGANGADGVQG